MRRILREPEVPVAPVGAINAAVDEAMAQRLKAVYERARGNAVRMGQILVDEHDQDLAYSTLTRWVRQAELREPPKRSGEYHFAPGQEMQHDTSPHRIEVAGRPVTAQCAGLTDVCALGGSASGEHRWVNKCERPGATGYKSRPGAH